MPAVPPEILAKFAEFGFEKDWVQGEYDIFMETNPSGKISKSGAMDRLKTAAAERFPNADAANVAEFLYQAFDPENKGEIDFMAAARGVAILYCANIEIRAQIFFSLVDEAGDGKISKTEMNKFLDFANETQALGLDAAAISALNDEIFTTIGKSELTFEDVREVVAARWA